MKKKEAPAKVNVQLTVSRSMYDLITRLSKKLGQTRSAMIRDLLEQQVPIFEVLEKSIDQIKLGDQEKARAFMDQYTGQVQAALGKERKQLRGKKQ